MTSLPSYRGTRLSSWTPHCKTWATGDGKNTTCMYVSGSWQGRYTSTSHAAGRFRPVEVPWVTAVVRSELRRLIHSSAGPPVVNKHTLPGTVPLRARLSWHKLHRDTPSRGKNKQSHTEMLGHYTHSYLSLQIDFTP